MFEAKLSDIGILRDVIATVSEIIDEAEIQVEADGIRMVSADRAVVAVVSFFLSRNAFEEYLYNEDMKVGINISSLLQILKRSVSGDSLTLKIDDKMELNFKGSSMRRFVLPFIDISKNETPPIDKLEFSASMEADAEVLNSGIEDADIIGDSVVMTVRKEQFVMKAENSSSSTQLELPSGTDELRIMDINEPVRARYPIDYLKKIFKARKFSPRVEIYMSTDFPIKIIFKVPEKVQMSFILAPRVEE